MTDEAAYEELAAIMRMGQISAPHRNLLKSILGRLTVMEDQAQPATMEPATKDSPLAVGYVDQWGNRHWDNSGTVSITAPTQPSQPSETEPVSLAASVSECVHHPHLEMETVTTGGREGQIVVVEVGVRCRQCNASWLLGETHVLAAAPEPSSISTCPRPDSPPSVASSLSAAARSLSGPSKSWAVDVQPDGWRVSNGQTGLGAFTSWAGAANCAAMLNVRDDLAPHHSQFQPPSVASLPEDAARSLSGPSRESACM